MCQSIQLTKEAESSWVKNRRPRRIQENTMFYTAVHIITLILFINDKKHFYIKKSAK